MTYEDVTPIRNWVSSGRWYWGVFHWGGLVGMLLGLSAEQGQPDYFKI